MKPWTPTCSSILRKQRSTRGFRLGSFQVFQTSTFIEAVFIEVYTAFVDDTYCRYHENRELNKYLLLPSVDRRDTDY